MMDLHRIATLLHVAEKSRLWPGLQGLHDAALAELRHHAKGAKFEPPKEVEELTEELKAEQKLQAEEDLHHAAHEEGEE